MTTTTRSEQIVGEVEGNDGATVPVPSVNPSIVSSAITHTFLCLRTTTARSRESRACVYTAPVGLHGEHKIRPVAPGKHVLEVFSRSPEAPFRIAGDHHGARACEMHDLRIRDPRRRRNRHDVAGGRRAKSTR